MPADGRWDLTRLLKGLKSVTKQRVLYMKTYVHSWSYLAPFFLEWEMFQTKDVEGIKTHILFPVAFYLLQKSYRLWDNVKKKYCTKGQATDDIMTHAHCMLDN